MRHSEQIDRLIEEEEHGEGGDDLWIVSYADMVTLLFGFFVILYSFSTLDEKKFDQMGNKMAEAFNSKTKTTETDAAGINDESRQTRALRMIVSMMNLGENLDEVIEKIENNQIDKQEIVNAQKIVKEKFSGNAGVSTATTPAENRSSQPIVSLALPVHVLFASGTDVLTPTSIKMLKDLAQTLNQIDGVTELEISGHTDSRPPAPGSLFSNNWVLSSARAGAVAQVLIKYGLNEERIRVLGMAHLQPLFPEFGAQGQPLIANMEKNRRVQIIVKKRVSSYGH